MECFYRRRARARDKMAEPAYAARGIDTERGVRSRRRKEPVMNDHPITYVGTKPAGVGWIDADANELSPLRSAGWLPRGCQQAA